MALALVALMGIPNVLFYRELSGGYYPEEKKRIRVFNWVFSIAIAALWGTVVIANHTTVLQDIINFAFLAGFSFVFAIIAVLAFVVVISVVVFVLVTLYYIVCGVVALFGKASGPESEISFFDKIE